jgi:hypothetical protein
VLKKGGKNFDDIDTRIPAGAPMWDASELAAGDIFSGTSYYETVSETGSKHDPMVLCYDKLNNNDPVQIDRCILNETMTNANVFDEEEKLTKTALATKLAETDSQAIQVCFTTQPNEKAAVEVLSGLAAAPRSAAKAKDLIE